MNMDYYINVAELMTNIDDDRAEPITELPILTVECCEVEYHD